MLERGVGLDRSLYKLPALLVDDFADVTPRLVQQAYVEALYRADEWDYKRITQRWWALLLFKVWLVILRVNGWEGVNTTVGADGRLLWFNFLVLI